MKLLILATLMLTSCTEIVTLERDIAALDKSVRELEIQIKAYKYAECLQRASEKQCEEYKP